MQCLRRDRERDREAERETEVYLITIQWLHYESALSSNASKKIRYLQ